MVNLKKYNLFSLHFVLFLTFVLSASCSQQKYYVTKIEGKQIAVTQSQTETQAIEDFIAPYREHINKDLNTVLAFSPQALEKSKGEWQSTIGNLMADVTLQKADVVFEKREKKHIDICLLNHGGIRSIIPKGNVTTRTAFEIMPFENSVMVVALQAAQLREIANYIIKEKKPHPLAGMQFTIGKDGIAKNITVQGVALDENKMYRVATSDYLANGGDNMTFFKKGTAKYDMDYKLRNILIDYFEEVDTIPMITDKRIFVE